MAAKLVERDPYNRKLLEELEPGDLIEFPRGAYSHWALYIGNEEVVHLTGEDNDGINGQSGSGHVFTICGQRFEKALVKIDNFWDVVLGCKARKNNSKDRKLKPLTPTEIVQNALSKLGKIGYNILFENCEHFASWCRYGTSKSDQVDGFMRWMAVAVAGAAVITGGLVGAISASRKEKKEKE